VVASRRMITEQRVRRSSN